MRLGKNSAGHAFACPAIAGKGRDSSMSSLIDASGVEKSFVYGKGKKLRKNKVLRGIDFSVKEGEFVSIVGPSGSGKTTLLNCLSGLEEVDSGSVSLDGNLISSMNIKEKDEVRRRLVSFVFQNLNLIPSLNAVDNIWIPARLSGKRITKKDALVLLDDLGVVDRAKDYPGSLSGGEQQRIAIARSMAAGSPIIFADEPTGSLDIDNTRVVMNMMRRESREGNRAVVMVTHDLTAAAYSDRVVVLKDGMIAAELSRPAPHEIALLLEE